jgi:hypothetical protein
MESINIGYGMLSIQPLKTTNDTTYQRVKLHKVLIYNILIYNKSAKIQLPKQTPPPEGIGKKSEKKTKKKDFRNNQQTPNFSIITHRNKKKKK